MPPTEIPARIVRDHDRGTGCQRQMSEVRCCGSARIDVTIAVRSTIYV